jgi:hypothetical protein
MVHFRRVATTALMLLATTVPATMQAQEGSQAREAYFRAVADFFQVAPGEISVLGEWELPPEEIPVALFVAGRAGVSPEAVVALRRSGWGWQDLARRYHLDASHFHVPLPQGADTGVLSEVYRGYRSLPSEQWRTLTLDDRQIVMLVNLRVISQTLRIPAEEVLSRMSRGTSSVDLYASLLRNSGLR